MAKQRDDAPAQDKQDKPQAPAIAAGTQDAARPQTPKLSDRLVGTLRRQCTNWLAPAQWEPDFAEDVVALTEAGLLARFGHPTHAGRAALAAHTNA